MELEMEPRVKPLSYKVKALSRESTSQKGSNVLDYDLRTHWSTGTNNKEWILLELDEPCLLSQIRIYNKSVLEWEISVGLRYKPETFVRVRPRCEAPRRDMIYPMNYAACKYVRISCLRGNPIAIYFIQLIGVPVPGLEPEFQPVVNYLLPQVLSHKQDSQDMHLQLLQDITSRLLVFLPQLEADLVSFSEAAESEIRFLAMLVGPFYPILRIVNERASFAISDSDSSKGRPTSTVTISSNFEAQPRRSRSPSFLSQVAPSIIAFRSEVVLMLLRKAYNDSDLGKVCRTASAALHKLVKFGPNADSTPVEDSLASCNGDGDKTESPPLFLDVNDYSSLFGDDFKMFDDNWFEYHMSLVDIAVVEEAVLHFLYACASQPSVCCKLVDNIPDFWSALPLIQAMLPALRPLPSSPLEQVDERFSQWNQPIVQRALHQITTMLSSSMFRSLVHASAGYLLSFSSSQVKTACVLVDLCSGPLSPWINTVIVKIDLVMELLEDLLPTFQCFHQSASHARAALKCIIIGISGHVDDILGKYKEIKHKLLFLVEMLEPFLDPSIAAIKNVSAFGDIPPVIREKQEQNCAIALNIIRTAVGRPGVLPSLEYQWRQGTVAPSVLLSILVPHMTLPPEIDLCTSSVAKMNEKDDVSADTGSLIPNQIYGSKSSAHDEAEGKSGLNEAMVKSDGFEDVDLFAPMELKNVILDRYRFSEGFISETSDNNNIQEENGNEKFLSHKSVPLLNSTPSVDYCNLLEDYSHLINLDDCDKRASEFQRLAKDLCSQQATSESHDAAIDALLLAAECYINPVFMSTFRSDPLLVNQINKFTAMIHRKDEITEVAKNHKKRVNNLDSVSNFERKRDKLVIEILIQAAEWEKEHQRITGLRCSEGRDESETFDQSVRIPTVDMQSADAVTLLRHHQALICHFLMKRLLTGRQNSLEVLMQSLLFYLQYATEQFCAPDKIIDIIIRFSENLNETIRSLCHKHKEHRTKSDWDKFYMVRRSWVLLQRLIVASSGGDTDKYHCVNFVPLSSWIVKIPSFASSSFPLARFSGWMAVANFAKQYLQGKLFFVLDLSQLTPLLSIFVDELLLADNAIVKDSTQFSEDNTPQEAGYTGQSHNTRSHVYPELNNIFPDLCLQLQNYGLVILEAVSLQLKSLPFASVPDGLCWLSDFCLSPFLEIEKHDAYKKNFPQCYNKSSGKNAKAIIYYLLKAMVGEHMDTLVLEMPRIAQILVALCKTSYCDVDFLDSMFLLLKPIISCALVKVTDSQMLSNNNLSYDYESLCFQELFDSIKQEKGSMNNSGDKICHMPLFFFILGSLFSDLSFQRKIEILQSLTAWDITSSELTSAHLRAFQSVLDNLLECFSQHLESFLIQYPDAELWRQVKETLHFNENLKYFSGKLEGVLDRTECSKDYLDASESFANPASNRTTSFSLTEIDKMSALLEELLPKIHCVINCCWKSHFQLGTKLCIASAKCCLLMKCLTFVSRGASDIQNLNSMEIHQQSKELSYIISSGWQAALQALATMILTLQNSHCWQVASVMLDFLFGLPEDSALEGLFSSICLAIKSFSSHAPKLSWRLQTDKWLLSLFGTKFYSVNRDVAPLADLFCVMLGHSEPEQRSIVLKHLGTLVGLDTSVRVTNLSCVLVPASASSDTTLSISSANVSKLVLNTWDKVAVVASTDPLSLLRAHAMALLSGFIPHADRSLLQSFFVSAPNILPGLGTHARHMQDPFIRLSLTLLACACVYSPVEDISLLPENIWRTLEDMATSKSGLNGAERKLCQALCELKDEVVDAKGVLSEILSSSSSLKQQDFNFQNTRESILQVLSSLKSVQSYFDFFAKKTDEETQEIEETEIELDLLRKEMALPRVSERLPADAPPFPILSDYSRDEHLNKLKNELRELERSKLREEILARRQKKLLAARDRQKLLDEAMLREMEFLEELDKKKISEMELDIERQRELEAERAKTRELQYNLDLERERQAQRELQRKIELTESGNQLSQRDFSSVSSRTRERYRDRDNGRSTPDTSLRPSSRGRESNTLSSVPTIVLSGASHRTFSNQPPTILQSRDRSNDQGAGYDDVNEGSRDSGDTGSVGDPDTSFDGMSGGLGSGTRRGGKSRQIADRRERDGRREGKWERKHS